MRLIFTLILLAFSAGIYAQQISGRVLDKETKKPVVFATLATRYVTAFTSEDGEFSLRNLHRGDTITISSMGYKPYKMAVKTNNTDTLTIYLQQVSILLRDVSVRARHDQKLDSIRNRREFESAFNYHDPTIKDVFITKNPYAYIPNNYIDATNSTASIVSVNLLSVVSLLSKNKNTSSKLQQVLIKDEEGNYIDRVFSRKKIIAITNMHGDSLQDFMSEYRPSLPQAKKMTDYEMLLYIKTSYSDFIKNYDHAKQSPFGH